MDLPSVIALVLVAACIPLGWYLARRWRMPDYTGKFIVILLAAVAGLAICIVRWDSVRLGIDLQGGVILVYEVVGGVPESPGAAEGESRAATAELSRDQMDKLIAAIGRRVNPGGQKEVIIRQFGPRQVEIIVPEKKRRSPEWDSSAAEGQIAADSAQADVERLKRILSSAGTLEFRILANPLVHQSVIAEAQKLTTETQLKGPGGALLAFWVPVATKARKDFENDPDVVKRVRKVRNEERLEVLVIKDEWDVTGAYLVRAVRGTDEKGGYAVHFSFNAAGGNLFGRLTGNHLPDDRRNLKYRLGIILDGYLESAPVIQSTIFENGQITGRFTAQEVDELVEVLNAGALPATLSKEPISQRVIGPTLGRDTIRKGMNSLAISVAAVLLFMLVYYRFAGLVANLALAMNSVLLLAIMILIQAPFTLPGLAGFALTVGMAVDANVLIYERMREEILRGAALRMVIRNGFERASSAIVDSNLTTLITGAVLYAIGTDQVRGFAVTLFLGVLLNLFTAVYCARVLFDVAERRKWFSRINMLQLIGQTNFDFLRLRWPALGLSVAIIVVGLVASVWRGRGLFDIDFTGGVSVEVVFTQPQDIADVRAKLADLPDVVVSDVRLEGEPVGYRFVINTSNPPDLSADQYLRQVKEHLRQLYGDLLSHNEMSVSELAVQAGRGRAPAEETPLAAGRSEWALLSALLLSEADAKAPREPKPAPPSKAPGDSKSTTRPAVPAVASDPQAKDTSVRSAKASAPAATHPPSAKPAAEAPKQPEAPKQTEVPKQAEPVKQPAESAKQPGPRKEAEGPKPVESPKPTEPPKPKEPTGSGPPAYRARLTFVHPIRHDDLLEVFRDQVEAMGMARDSVEIALTHAAYEEGSAAPSKTWDVSIHLADADAKTLVAGVQKYFRENPYFPQSDTIGGAVAQNTRYRAVMALLASTLFILLYLWVRFQRVSYGLGAVVALVHDVLVALAFVAISYWLAQIPVFGQALAIEPFKINLVMVSALLTIAGYSINDTIVVFDRIREVRGKAPQVTGEMINLSINQTLSRTLLTGLTTILVVVVLYILGGPTIHGFSYAMILGIIAGTYSSIYIAAPVLLWFGPKRPAQEGTRP